MKSRINDIVCIFMIHLARLKREAGPFLLASIVFPTGMYLFAGAIAAQAATASEDSKRHFLASSMVFSLSLTGVSWLGYLLLENRFMGRVKLFATLPLATSSYIAGLTLFAFVQGIFGITSLLVVGKLLGVSVTLSSGSVLLLFTVMVLALLTLSGLSVVIASRVRSFSEGSLLTDALGAGMVLMAPVYYPASALPSFMRWIGYILPTTYIASAFEKALSGNIFVIDEVVLLAVFGIAITAAGFWSMRWREE